jgi:hypothetical protein
MVPVYLTLPAQKWNQSFLPGVQVVSCRFGEDGVGRCGSPEPEVPDTAQTSTNEAKSYSQLTSTTCSLTILPSKIKRDWVLTMVSKIQ